MRISLRPELEQFIEEKVRQGAYPDADAVVNDALEILREQDQTDECPPQDAQKLEELRRELQVAIDQADRGDFADFTAEDVICQGKEVLRQRRAEGKGD